MSQATTTDRPTLAGRCGAVREQTTVGGEVVKVPGEEHRAVDASALTFMLLNAVNELAVRVAALEKDNAHLRSSTH
jgi:hypothetical protein